MKKVFRANMYFLIILLLQLFLPVYKIFEGFDITDSKLILLINHTVIFLVPAIIYLLVTRQSPKKVLKLNKLHFKDAILIVVLAFICQPIMMFFSVISQMFFENRIGDFVTEIVSAPYILLLLLLAVLPAITEEITIRGIVLSGYEDKNIFIACGMTGLLFGIMHLDPQQFLYAAVLGFILAYLVRVTNSIFAGALLHFIINGTSVTIQKAASMISSTLENITESSQMSIMSLSMTDKILITGVYGIIAIAFSVLAYLVLRKIGKNNLVRGNINTASFSISRNELKDSVINVPFIITICIYLVFMILNFFV